MVSLIISNVLRTECVFLGHPGGLVFQLEQTLPTVTAPGKGPSLRTPGAPFSSCLSSPSSASISGFWLGFVPKAQTCCGRARRPQSGQEPLALLIGSAPSCSVFGLLDTQRVGPGSLPGGSTQTAAPAPWGPGPSWHLEDLLPGLMAVFRGPAQRRYRQLRIHTWHTVGALHAYVVVN